MLRCPVGQFTIDAGTYRFEGKVGLHSPAYKPAQTVEVAFDPLNPSNGARIVSEKGQSIFVIVSGMIGISLLALGVREIIRKRKH